MQHTVTQFEAEIGTAEYLKDYVDVDYFLSCCKVCRNYGHVWACPPYDFDPRDLWRKYDRLRVYGYQVRYSGERTQKEMEEVLWQVKERLDEEMLRLETETPGSLALSAGSCKRCRTCSRPEGKPCRFPQLMRHSIESVGGDVGKTIEKLCGIEIQWAKEGCLPEYYVVAGGLLTKDQ